MNGSELIKKIELTFPLSLAYEWDNVGLMIGTINKQVNKVMLALDLTKEVMEQAVMEKVDLVITHHPFIFSPLKAINFETPKGHIIKKMVENNISVYSMHTNFDCAEFGMNYALGNALKLLNMEVLDDLDHIGVIGDVEPVNLNDFIVNVKNTLGLEQVHFFGNDQKEIKRVAIVGGSGTHHIGIAKRKKADIFLTGDITYHVGLDIDSLGLNALDIGHYAEKIFVNYMSDYLINLNSELSVLKAKEKNPYKVY